MVALKRSGAFYEISSAPVVGRVRSGPHPATGLGMRTLRKLGIRKKVTGLTRLQAQVNPSEVEDVKTECVIDYSK